MPRYLSFSALPVLMLATGIAAADPTLAEPPAPPSDTDRYVSVMATGVAADDARDVDFGAGVHALIGSPISEQGGVVLEFGGFGNVFQRDEEPKHDWAYGIGLDLVLRKHLYFLRRHRVTPFFLFGGGAIHDDHFGERETSPYANAGVGFLATFAQKPIALRAEVRALRDFNDESFRPEKALTDIRVNVGLQLLLARPEAAEVELDSDGDGVPNSRDRCPNTPRGVQVGPDGCELDGDNDGVPDSRDRCPNTPAGAVVDQHGCSKDTDGDGVPDGGDYCPNTPPNTEVDTYGCTADRDGDGVLNQYDQCPNTLPGLSVDPTGCVVEPQSLVLDGVNFEFDKARLTANAKTTLDRVAMSLIGQPGLVVEIGGHTDAMGSDSYNLALSERRAASVRQYLLSRNVPEANLSSRGYGETKPIASNDTDAGRELNRRVEFKVLQR